MALSLELKIHFNIYTLHCFTMIQGCVLFCYYQIESILLANQVLNRIHSMDIQILCGEELIVTKEGDCSMINQGNWSSIIVFSGLCNSYYDNVIITNNSCLQLINIQNNALQNINTLVISDNPNLIVFIVGRYGSYYATDVSLTS